MLPRDFVLHSALATVLQQAARDVSDPLDLQQDGINFFFDSARISTKLKTN
ncbi:Uncharacterised protein [Vibrio cholerae]|uniref:Uncharacterized protein n=1 Tax=Vibrio cholerae TaxID=666 RepID=A0A655TEN0_VIBCL|nr:Uncharacterised protein [Vibrio cholerae]CSA69758.1 Uncharacterised protein [Vibrio cholerae]CSB34864.1 Uncharacterised protein [Vibrio cholerae]CSB60833.1 Uncharacterised protein [Vibrio cholerae]CSC23688.1 Uncharacterised protein [Vibrio cholerae]